MTSFGWDYPPGVSSIPGDFDVTISFTVSFLYESELDVDEVIEDIPQLIKDHLLIDDLEFDQSSFKIDESGKFSIVVSYSDDMCYDGRDIDYDDIDEIIINYINEEIMPYHAKLDYCDPSIEIDYKVHN